MTKRTYSQDYAERRKNAELAKIHIAKTELGWDEATYRDILRRLGGVNSSKDLTALGRAKVLDYARQHGFTAKTAAEFPGRTKTTASHAQLQKIEALLADAKLSWAYAVALAKQMYKKQRLEFCTADELGGIITALTLRNKKAGLVCK